MLDTIQHGDKGRLVRIAQLLTAFAKRGESSDDFSARFVAHVCAWQRQRGLTPDGVIGPKTWGSIAEEAPTCSETQNRESAASEAVQRLLDGAALTVDGIYGKRTKAAVEAYQASVRLSADGVCGRKTWAALIVEDAPSGEFVQPVDYKQGDPRWGKKNYTSTGNKSQTMANSGCGPTAMADIVATLKHPSATPWTLAQLSMKWGTRTASSGTAWSFFPKVREQYHFSKMIQTSSLATLKACLDAGGYAVCSMGPGYWTKGGHFVCAWKYDGSYIYCNDPASKTRKRQKIAAFMSERKQFFCFYA